MSELSDDERRRIEAEERLRAKIRDEITQEKERGKEARRKELAEAAEAASKQKRKWYERRR